MNTEKHPFLNSTRLIYALHLLAPFMYLIPAVVAVIIGSAYREHVQGSWLDSHYSWLSRTFWWALLWVILALGVCGLAFFLRRNFDAFIFLLLPASVAVWYVYRVVRGWLSLNASKPI
jgi:uncharacterized membrane protein